MRVIMFRHGPAGQRDAKRWPDDGLRPLTSRGEQRTQQAARGLARLEPDVRLIATSPLTRALQTAHVLEQVFGDAEMETLDALRPAGSYREAVQFLAARRADDVVALVGHEPDLGKLAGVLVFGAPAAIPLKKAGACSIEFEAVAKVGEGRLCWMLPPRFLRRMAGKKDKV